MIQAGVNLQEMNLSQWEKQNARRLFVCPCVICDSSSMAGDRRNAMCVCVCQRH